MNPPKMSIHIGDYHRDTGHLRAAEHGAYLLLLFHYWSTGGLPDDDRQLSAVARMSPAEWKRARPIIQQLFKEGWKHKRVDYELEKSANIARSAREAGLASGRTRSQRKSNGRSTVVEPTLEPSTLEERKEDTASAVSSATAYAFESGVIRLSERDFNKWKDAFSHLDLKAELLALTEWAGQQPKWFFAVSAVLAKRNREAKVARERQQQQPFKWNGIEGVV